MSGCPWKGGPRTTINHDALDPTVQLPPHPSADTGPHCTTPSPSPRSAPPHPQTWDITVDLFKLIHLRTQTPLPSMYGPCKRVVYIILECFLVNTGNTTYNPNVNRKVYSYRNYRNR